MLRTSYASWDVPKLMEALLSVIEAIWNCFFGVIRAGTRIADSSNKGARIW